MRTIIVVAAIFAIVLLCADIAVEFATLDLVQQGTSAGLRR
jgi:hypothetical protein